MGQGSITKEQVSPNMKMMATIPLRTNKRELRKRKKFFLFYKFLRMFNKIYKDNKKSKKIKHKSITKT